jgi:protein SCO1/2
MRYGKLCRWMRCGFILVVGVPSFYAVAHGICTSAAHEPDIKLTSDSVYQLKTSLIDQDARPFNLSSKRGKLVIVGMFYNTCKFVCPTLIDAMRSTQAGLTVLEKERVELLLITIDPIRDDVAVLKNISVTRHLDTSRWTLGRTDPDSVRKLAAAIGIQYRQLPDGEFNHTTELILLDTEGRIAGRTAKMGQADPDFLNLIRQNIVPK